MVKKRDPAIGDRVQVQFQTEPHGEYEEITVEGAVVELDYDPFLIRTGQRHGKLQLEEPIEGVGRTSKVIHFNFEEVLVILN